MSARRLQLSRPSAPENSRNLITDQRGDDHVRSRRDLLQWRTDRRIADRSSSARPRPPSRCISGRPALAPPMANSDSNAKCVASVNSGSVLFIGVATNRQERCSTGASTSSVWINGKRKHADRNECDDENHHRWRKLAQQRLRHFRDRRDHQADRCCGNAGQDAAQNFSIAELRIEKRQKGRDQRRRSEQAGECDSSARRAAHARAEHHRHVDDVRSRRRIATARRSR